MEFAPYTVDVPEEALDDLRARLERTRLPNQIEGIGWEQGTERSFLVELLDHWRTAYDWRAQEARLDAFPHLTTEVDGQRLHLIHARSPHEGALPLLLTHGWPGSVVEFLDVLEPLTNPLDPADAFHVVAPSLPGFAFSGETTKTGWQPLRRIAEAFVEIVGALGYERFGAQGGDWGSFVSGNVADLAPDRVVGLHLNYIAVGKPADAAPLTEQEQREREALDARRRTGAGYQGAAGHEAPDARLRAAGLPRRAGRVDHREVRDLERGRPPLGVLTRPLADQRHGVLGYGDGSVVVPHLLGMRVSPTANLSARETSTKELDDRFALCRRRRHRASGSGRVPHLPH